MSHAKTQMPPNSAARQVSSSSRPIFRRSFRLPFLPAFRQHRHRSRTNAAAPQSSNAAPAKSRPPLQYKSASPTAATPQLSSPPRSLLEAQQSAAKTDQGSAHAPAARRESSSPAPQ